MSYDPDDKLTKSPMAGQTAEPILEAEIPALVSELEAQVKRLEERMWDLSNKLGPVLLIPDDKMGSTPLKWTVQTSLGKRLSAVGECVVQLDTAVYDLMQRIAL